MLTDKAGAPLQVTNVAMLNLHRKRAVCGAIRLPAIARPSECVPPGLPAGCVDDPYNGGQCDVPDK